MRMATWPSLKRRKAHWSRCCWRNTGRIPVSRLLPRPLAPAPSPATSTPPPRTSTNSPYQARSGDSIQYGAAWLHLTLLDPELGGIYDPWLKSPAALLCNGGCCMQGHSRSIGMRLLALTVMVSLSLPPWALARVQPSSGFDLFSADQEVQVGKQAAADTNKQLPVLPDSDPIVQYVQQLG